MIEIISLDISVKVIVWLAAGFFNLIKLITKVVTTFQEIEVKVFNLQFTKVFPLIILPAELLFTSFCAMFIASIKIPFCSKRVGCPINHDAFDENLLFPRHFSHTNCCLRFYNFELTFTFSYQMPGHLHLLNLVQYTLSQ